MTCQVPAGEYTVSACTIHLEGIVPTTHTCTAVLGLGCSLVPTPCMLLGSLAMSSTSAPHIPPLSQGITLLCLFSGHMQTPWEHGPLLYSVVGEMPYCTVPALRSVERGCYFQCGVSVTQRLCSPHCGCTTASFQLAVAGNHTAAMNILVLQPAHPCTNTEYLPSTWETGSFLSDRLLPVAP